MTIDSVRVRNMLAQRKARHARDLVAEVKRLTKTAILLGVQRVILFGSAAQGTAGLSSDLDLLIVWDTPLDFLARTAEMYRCLQAKVAVDLLVYTPDEMTRMAEVSFIRRILENGKVLYEA